MQRIVFVLIAALLMVSSAMATTTCPNGGYDQYNPAPPGPSILCATNDLVFSNFGFEATASLGASLPTPASVNVTVLDVLGNEGFAFAPGLSASPGQLLDVTVSFEVAGFLDGAMISDLSALLTGSAFGTGSTSLSETYCTIDFTQGCNVFSGSQDVLIPPATHLFVTVQFSASGDTEDGGATISSVQTQFSQGVPEPASLLLVAAGLVGLATVGRRRKA